MTKEELERFLDTGWFSEAEIYYNGHMYFCQEDTIDGDQGRHFVVYRWPAKNEDNTFYHTIRHNGKMPAWETAYEYAAAENESEESIREKFLQAKFFDGKSFWEVEEKTQWLEKGSPVGE